jgi:alpha-glucosidase (family GH31 glycosyl hydrolase)
MMARVSDETLATANPERRTYVLTRSGNVGTFKYACSTWSGDNATRWVVFVAILHSLRITHSRLDSWNNLRGSQPIQLNAGISLMQAYGSDVGGFGGPLPNPELFVRWVQLGVTHSRFCIHSYKPNKEDPSGAAATNLPWMVSDYVVRDEPSRA